MTTETDCPSHIEARERAECLRNRLRRAYDTDPKKRMMVFGDDPEIIDTLLATPTQGDIGSALEEWRKLGRDAWGALNFILAFYEPGQRYLDTNAWKEAEAGGRRVHAALRAKLDEQNNTSDTPTQGLRTPPEWYGQQPAPTVGREEVARAIMNTPRGFNFAYAAADKILALFSPTERADPGAGEREILGAGDRPLSVGDRVRVPTGEEGVINRFERGLTKCVNVVTRPGVGGMYFPFECERLTAHSPASTSSGEGSSGLVAPPGHGVHTFTDDKGTWADVRPAQLAQQPAPAAPEIVEAQQPSEAAVEILANIRAGKTDARYAAKALGLGFDQDIITAILALASGAPEGWREFLDEAAKGFSLIHTLLMDPTVPRQSAGEVCATFLERVKDHREAALTSSSATGGENQVSDEVDEAMAGLLDLATNRIEALAQSNRRLREGLEKIASADKESWQRRLARAALKDNGHG